VLVDYAKLAWETDTAPLARSLERSIAFGRQGTVPVKLDLRADRCGARRATDDELD